MNDKKVTEESLVKLLYFDEHITCRNYVVHVETGFKIFRFSSKSECVQEDIAKKNYLLFFLEGEFMVTNNQYERNFKAGEIILIPRSSFYRIIPSPGAQLLSLFFDRPASNCDKLLLQTLSKEIKGMKYDFSPLPVICPLDKYLDLLVLCLKSGLSCIHFHETMQRELFLLLCGFYSREQISMLFYPIIGKKLNFKDFVIENSSKVHHVSELLAMSNMGKSQFYNKFKEEFGIPAKQWMLQQLNNRLFGMLTNPEVCIKDIVTDLGFSSQAQFTVYCKKHFGYTPRQLVDAFQGENKLFGQQLQEIKKTRTN
ncbi:helix-turn-helix domain-containing protein [Bacteroides congonensis]